ncbi:hypothetical protein ACSTS3_22710 [Aquimarina muelleri]|uniref:hypothetical protein n=1 Tax=Aquimarina muelleri TaxID=279356 RepID=UPI003F682C53
MNKIVLLVFSICLLGCKQIAPQQKSTSSDKENKIVTPVSKPIVNTFDVKGYWSNNCQEGSGYVDISENNTLKIEVNSNQVYLKGRYKNIKSNFFNIYFTSKDLGRGGSSLDWVNYDKDSIIGTLKLIDKKYANFNWLGFYNKKTKKREWVDNTDFKSPTLKKCDF